jgi:hypothetical protein
MYLLSYVWIWERKEALRWVTVNSLLDILWCNFWCVMLKNIIASRDDPKGLFSAPGLVTHEFHSIVLNSTPHAGRQSSYYRGAMTSSVGYRALLHILSHWLQSTAVALFAAKSICWRMFLLHYLQMVSKTFVLWSLFSNGKNITNNVLFDVAGSLKSLRKLRLGNFGYVWNFIQVGTTLSTCIFRPRVNCGHFSPLLVLDNMASLWWLEWLLISDLSIRWRSQANYTWGVDTRRRWVKFYRLLIRILSWSYII